MTELHCPYCGNKAELTTGEVLYPHRPDLFPFKFWACLPCDAWVGTHKNSKDHKPLGRMANAELRKAKRAAHASFDPWWHSGYMNRREAYSRLAELMGLAVEDTHIGMFDVEQCKKVIMLTKPQIFDERKSA